MLTIAFGDDSNDRVENLLFNFVVDFVIFQYFMVFFAALEIWLVENAFLYQLFVKIHVLVSVFGFVDEDLVMGWKKF